MGQFIQSGRDLCAEMLRRLNYQVDCPVITVAGTNGKGTSCHLLADYWRRRGRCVGLFTSPHLLRFNERIRVGQRDATDVEINAAMLAIKRVQGELFLGYFHLAFLAALLIFKEAGVDLLILEVGIGGRLDAVNAIDADAVLITAIALDHTELLGENREQIGYEKAGILRANQLAVCADFNPPQSILDYAGSLGLNCYIAGRDFFMQDIMDYPEGFIPRQNALGVWALLKKYDPAFDVALFKQALAELHVPGRMHVISKRPYILLDVAHNPHSAAYLANHLAAHPVAGRTYAVFSALQDKDISGICKPFLSQVDHWFLCALKHERAANFAALHQALPQSKYTDFNEVSVLYQKLVSATRPEDRIVVFGSFLLVSLFLECHNQLNLSSRS